MEGAYVVLCYLSVAQAATVYVTLKLKLLLGCILAQKTTRYCISVTEIIMVIIAPGSYMVVYHPQANLLQFHTPWGQVDVSLDTSW